MSNSSRHSSQPPEDWDHPESTIDPSNANSAAPTRVVFPSQGGADDTPGPDAPPLLPHAGSRTGAGKRTLSELLKLHAEKGTNVHFTPEEANRLGEVLGQWVRLPFALALTLAFSFFITLPCILPPRTMSRPVMCPLER